MGVKHIFLTAPFGWGGKIMTSLLRILRSFTEDGSVSMTSHADDNIDYLYSTAGLSWIRDSIEVYQVKELSTILFQSIGTHFKFY